MAAWIKWTPTCQKVNLVSTSLSRAGPTASLGITDSIVQMKT